MNVLTNDRRMLEYGINQIRSNIFCFSTTRHGGYSQGRYASFNCNHYCGDAPEDVRRNREMLCQLLPETPRHLIVPHQTHGDTIRIIDRDFLEQTPAMQTEALEGVDATVTSLRHECLCVSTADCIPVLCYDTRRDVIAAIHAGWRGTVKRIVAKTVQLMKEKYGSNGEDIVACIGPGISREAFEVGDEVYEAFHQEGFPMQLLACRKDKWHIDLWEANRLQLIQQGVCPEQIEVSGICTYTEADTFFSARRMGIHSGRILSGILLY